MSDQPAMDAVEAVAQALYVAKGAHNVFGPWEAQLYQSLKEPFRRQAKALAEPIVAEALAAARPLIAAECAALVEKMSAALQREHAQIVPVTNAIATAIKETIR